MKQSHDINSAGRRWLRFLGLLSSMIVFLAGVAGTPGQSSGSGAEAANAAVIARAQESIGRGDTTGAIQTLSVWLEDHPRDSSVLLFLGTVYGSTGDVDHAEPVLSRAVKLHPTPQARLEWASVLVRLHRYQEAQAALAGLPEPALLKQRIAYRRLKASMDSGLGNAKLAARDMEEALQLAPDDRNLVLATGIAEVSAGAWTQAIAHLEPAFTATHDPPAGLSLLQAELGARADHATTLKELLSLDLPPSDRLALRAQLGEMLSRAGLDSEAILAFQQAVDAAPDRADLYFDLALAQLRAGQADGALATAQRAQLLSDNADLQSLIGDLQEARGDSVAAAHSYQAAVSLAPDKEQYRLELGLELLKHGTFEPALTVFQEAAGAFPNSSRVRTALGLTYFFLERYPEAIQTLLDAGNLEPNSQLALTYLGEIQLQQQVTPATSAIDQICRYADTHRSQPEMLAYCGALQLRVEHDRGDARASAGTTDRLREAVRRMPSSATAHCGWGQALEWNQQWQAAETEMESCLRLRPESAEAHYRMANIARHLGQTKRAEQELKLHNEAQQHLVEANAFRDRTLKKFLYFLPHQESSDSSHP